MFITILILIFPKFLSLMFLGKFDPIIWISSNWLKFRIGVHCYMLITALMFIFSKKISFTFLGQIWSKNLKFYKLTEICCKRTLLYAYYNFNVYFFKNFCHWYNFGQIWSQNPIISKLTEIWYKGTLLYAD